MMRGDRLDAIIRFADLTSSKEYEMSIFPAKILLATAGYRKFAYMKSLSGITAPRLICRW
jgi:hypothetical protein